MERARGYFSNGKPSAAPELFGELDPEPRLLMGPGPVDVYPRVLRAMWVALQGQFDPQFTAYMGETMTLYRQVFRTQNHWTLLIDGTARAASRRASPPRWRPATSCWCQSSGASVI